MQHCKVCGSELTNQAHFCNFCGTKLYVDDSADVATYICRVSTQDLPTTDAQTAVNVPTGPLPMSAIESENPDITIRQSWSEKADSQDITIRQSWSEVLRGQHPTLAKDQKDEGEDEWRRRDMLLGLPLLEFVAEDGQAFAGNVPTVQGTPQADDVPTVQGSPAMPAHAPSSAAPSWTPPRSPLPHHAQGTTPTRHAQHHPRPGVRHLLRPHGLASHLLIAGVAVVVILTGVIGGALAIFHPSLSLSMSGSINPGGAFQLHGRNFIPGGSVTLTLDHGAPLASLGHGEVGEAPRGAESTTATPLSTIAAQLALASASNISIPINGSGTFDVTVRVSKAWSVGMHTVHAMDSLLGRNADLQFTIQAARAQLEVRPSSQLDFGSLEKGGKAALSVLVGDVGGKPLRWTADAGATTWLKIQPASGTILPGSLEQTIYIVADTSNLAVKDYNAVLRVSSDAGEARLAVKLKVVPPSSKKQAVLDVNPSSLDFGTQPVGNQATLSVAVANTGTQELGWKADTGNASWLHLSRSTGKILPGGLPQTIYVTTDTTRLAAGSYSAMLTIKSNGGNKQIAITVVVTGAAQTATPPNTPPPNLSVSPSSLNGNTDCSYTQGQGWTCVATLSSPGAQSNLSWSASGSGIRGITFYPPNGTLTPGQATQVSIVILDTTCPATATFAFTGPANTVNVSWSCTPPPPLLTAVPASLNGNTDCTYAQGHGWSCSATLSNASAQSSLSWSASSSGITGIVFTPNSGTLHPSQSMLVSISVPDTTCPASATFTFTGPANTVSVPWSCTPPSPPVLTESPASLNFGTLNGATSKTLAVQVGNSGGQPLTWNADTGGTNWLSLDTTSGTIQPGDPAQTINVTANTSGLSAGNYSATVNITSNGGNVPVAVSLNVIAQPSPPGVSPNPLDFGTINQGTTKTLQETVSNTGRQPLNWNVDTGGTSWLSVDTPSGTVQPGSQQTINVMANASNLQPGNYSATLNYTSNGGNVQVAVSLVVTPPVSPCSLSASPTSLDLGTVQQAPHSTAAGSLTLSNSGGQPVTWNGDLGGASWLSLSPTSDTIQAGGQETIRIAVDASQLQPGPYSATLTFSSSCGSPQVIVTLVVTPPQPVMQLSANSLTFGQLGCNMSQSQPITITNGGGGTLTWTVDTSSQPSWLTVSPTNGSAPGTLTFTANSTGLNNTTYNATVNITGSDGTTQTVTVTLTVQCIP